MNKKFFESLLNIIMVAAISSCVISCGDDDVTINPGTGNEGDSNTDEVCVGTAVDIGLSVKFADRNVGAKNTEDLGILQGKRRNRNRRSAFADAGQGLSKE